MGDPLITIDNLKLALGAGATEQLRQLAGDDGTGQPDATRVAYGIAAASEQTYGILMGGFGTEEQIVALAANDVDVRHQVAMIAREVLAEGNAQFRTPDGKNAFASSARVARDVLREKSRGARRSSAEGTTAGGVTVQRSSLLRPRASASGKPLFPKCGGLF